MSEREKEKKEAESNGMESSRVESLSERTAIKVSLTTQTNHLTRHDESPPLHHITQRRFYHFTSCVATDDTTTNATLADTFTSSTSTHHHSPLTMRVAAHTSLSNVNSLHLSELTTPHNGFASNRKTPVTAVVSSDTESPSSDATSASVTASTATESDFASDDAATFTPMIRSHSLPFMPITPPTSLPVPSTFYAQTMPQQMMALSAPSYQQQQTMPQNALSNVTAQIEYAHQMHLLMNAPPNYYAQNLPQQPPHNLLDAPSFHGALMPQHDARNGGYYQAETAPQHLSHSHSHSPALVQTSSVVHPPHQLSHQPPPHPQTHQQSSYLSAHTPMSTLSMHDEVGGVDMGLVLGSKLIVKFLPPNTTQTALFDLFSPFGPLLTCKLITDKRTHQSLGYAFLSYTSAANAHSAIAQLNGMILEKRPIRVQLCQHADLYANSNKTTLWVSGLPRAHSHTDVHLLFSQYGSVKHVQMCGEEKKKGLAMVEFELPGEARRAIEQLHGRSLEQVYGTHHSGGINGGVPAGWTVPLVVKFAHEPSAGIGAVEKSPSNAQRQSQMNSARTERTRQQSPAQQTHNAQYNFTSSPSSSVYTPASPYAGSSAGEDHRATHSTVDKSLPPPSSPATSSASSGGAVNAAQSQSVLSIKSDHRSSDTVSLFVFHLPGSLTESDLKDLFRRHCSVVSVRIVHDQLTGESKGYGFVNVPTAEDATAAINALNGFAIDRKFIKVERKSGKGTRQLNASPTRDNSQTQQQHSAQFEQSNVSESKVNEIHLPSQTHLSNVPSGSTNDLSDHHSSSNSNGSSNSSSSDNSDTFNTQQTNNNNITQTPFNQPIVNSA